MERRSPRWTRYTLGYIAVLLVVAFATVSVAQVRIFPTPTPTPHQATPPPSTPTPPPSTNPTATPTDTDIPLPTSSEEPSESEKPKGSGSPSPSKSPDETLDDLPPELEQPTLVVPVIPRTRPRNTARLVELLKPLTKYGFPLEQVLVEGMGRFPVAGVAYYRDDWLNPRYHPVPHLHHGLDIFADFGTPIRSPDRGYVSRFSNNPDSGGIGVWVRGSDGMAYYFAHLLERAPGLRVGQRVDVGTVVGFVGDSGNALGGAPHLHFEIHPYGGAAIPPKPSVDKWLDEAVELAPRWVEARRQEIDSKRNVLGGDAASPQPNKAELEASMLLTLLDPVGGSVGLLPRLDVAPAQRNRISSGVLLEVIRLRLDGYLFVPSSQGLHLAD